MAKYKKILLLFDDTQERRPGDDYRREFRSDSWATERDVFSAIKALGYSCRPLGLYENLLPLLMELEQNRPDIVFNLAEQFQHDSSHDRDIVSLLSLFKIPFTGCGPTGMTLAKNKALSKQILESAAIDIPRFTVIKKGGSLKNVRKPAFPLIVKPLKEEASYGISQASHVETESALKNRVRFIHESMGQDALVEEYIHGRELYAGVIGNHHLTVFPPRELKFFGLNDRKPHIATFQTKWNEKYRKKWGLRNQPAEPMPGNLRARIETISKKVYGALHLKGYARIDLRVTPDERITVLEANPNPILAKSEDFALSAKKYGLSYPKLIEKIIQLGFQTREK